MLVEETEAEKLLEEKVVKKCPSLDSSNLIYFKFVKFGSDGRAAYPFLRSILFAVEQDFFALRGTAAVSASGIEYIQLQAQQCQRSCLYTIIAVRSLLSRLFDMPQGLYLAQRPRIID